MSTPTSNATTANPTPAATTNTSPAQPPVAEQPATYTVTTTGLITATNDPITVERQRISAILTCPEAEGRDGLARMLALETHESVEIARRVLGAAPKATAAAAAPAPAPNALAAEMAKIPNPQVGPAGGGSANDDSPQAEAARVLAFASPARRITVAS